MKKLSIGDWVICRFYNTPDKKFYGEFWKAQIVQLDSKEMYPERSLVVKDENGRLHTIWKKEIKGRIS